MSGELPLAAETALQKPTAFILEQLKAQGPLAEAAMAQADGQWP